MQQIVSEPMVETLQFIATAEGTAVNYSREKTGAMAVVGLVRGS